MDEHAPKAINIVAGIGIALFIIGLVISAVTVAGRMSSKGVSKVSKLVGQLDENTYTQYDGETLKGDQVLSVIKQFQDDTIVVYVETATKNKIYGYTAATVDLGNGTASFDASDKMTSTEFAEAMHDAQDPSTNYYIAPTKDFACTVLRNSETGGITGLGFKLQ